VLPTPVFLFGLKRDDELFVDIERGKTLVIRHLAIGEPDDEGRRTIFFELNGQPREVKVTDRALAPSGPGKRMADEGDPAHVAAPMPGLVVAVSAQEGDAVSRGDRLLSIEAMKMETGVFAERDGVVTEVLVSAGTQVETKQLLMVVGDGDEPEPA
jgi:pyruvate carboxylase